MSDAGFARLLRVMRVGLAGIADDGVSHVGARLVGIFTILAILNVGSWVWAFVAFHETPALLAMALLVYGLGLRHAIDADHIAAIDNVTRKLMGEGKRPVAVGFYFALGHSAVVVLVAAAVTGATSALGLFRSLGEAGGTISTTVSAVFLLGIAGMNVLLFCSIWRVYVTARDGGVGSAHDLDHLLNARGLLARLFRPLFRLVSRSWHMFPLGFAFGLGFDTATEVAMFGLSASQAAEGVPLHAILVFPLLFAAGMSLLDTVDGVLMLRAYDWALVDPMRKLRYNMTITLMSAVIAVVIGGAEAIGLVTSKLGFAEGLREGVEPLNDAIRDLGFYIVAGFLVAWLVSYLAHAVRRRRGFVRLAGSAR